MLKLTLALLLSVSTVGCGKFLSKDGGGSAAATGAGTNTGPSPATRLSVKPYGTCDRKAVTTINLCVEATGSEYNDPGYLDILKSSCESTGGVYSANNCDFTTSFGTCVIDPNMTNETHVSYYAPEYTAQSAKDACALITGAVYIAH